MPRHDPPLTPMQPVVPDAKVDWKILSNTEINLPNTRHIDAAEHRDDPYGIFFNVLVTEDCEQ